MKIRRKIVSLVLLLMVSGSIVSCGNSNQEASVTTESTTQQETSTEQTTEEQTTKSIDDLSIEELESIANEGDAEAQFKLASKYYNGEDTQQDYQKAFEWYYNIADKNADAQYYIGSMYYKGQGVEQNTQLAMEWLIKSKKGQDLLDDIAEQGDITTQYQLGSLYDSEKDYSKALIFYTKAAEQGNSDAQNSLARMYYLGKGVSVDYQKAVEWYTKAAEQGNEQAKANLSYMLEIIAESQAKESENSQQSIDWDKCIEETKAELTNPEFFDFVNDIDIKVDESNMQINFSVVVNDSTDPAVALDFGDTILRWFNNYAKFQDSSLKSGAKNYYGGIYDEYDVIIGIAPLSKVSDSSQWFVFDAIAKGVQGTVPLKLQKPYR